MRILIIEDDKRLTYLMQKILETEKFSVDVAHTGGLGVEIALRGVYDVIILDWMLPDRDGPSICQTLRSAHLPGTTFSCVPVNLVIGIINTSSLRHCGIQRQG